MSDASGLYGRTGVNIISFGNHPEVFGKDFPVLYVIIEKPIFKAGGGTFPPPLPEERIEYLDQGFDIPSDGKPIFSRAFPSIYSQTEYVPIVYLDPVLITTRWSQHIEGGNGLFRVMISDKIFDTVAAVKDDWTLTVRYKEIGGSSMKLIYRGIFTKIARQRQGQMDHLLLEGIGGLVYLNRVSMRRSWSMVKVKDIIKHIIREFVAPATRVVYDANEITAGDYLVKSLNWDGPAIRLVKQLADLEGSVAWGIDEDFKFYFKPKASFNQNIFYIETEVAESSDFSSFGGAGTNRVNIRGEDFGTDVQLVSIFDLPQEGGNDESKTGTNEMIEEDSAFGLSEDITRAGQNKINVSKDVQEAIIIRTTDIPFLKQGSPIPFKIQWRDGDGESRDVQVQKIVYTNGGIKSGKVKDWFTSRGISPTGSHWLRSEIFGGKWGNDIVEQIEKIDAKVEQLRMRDAQRNVALSPMILSPRQQLSGTPPAQLSRGLFTFRQFQPNINQNFIFNGAISNIMNSRAYELVIRLRFMLEGGTFSTDLDRVVLLVKWMFPTFLNPSTADLHIRRVMLKPDMFPSPVIDTFTEHDAVFITRSDLAFDTVGTSEIGVIVERVGTDLEDSYTGDFLLQSVFIEFQKRIHVARENLGRLNVNRLNQ